MAHGCHKQLVPMAKFATMESATRHRALTADSTKAKMPSIAVPIVQINVFRAKKTKIVRRANFATLLPDFCAKSVAPTPPTATVDC